MTPDTIFDLTTTALTLDRPRLEGEKFPTFSPWRQRSGTLSQLRH